MNLQHYRAVRVSIGFVLAFIISSAVVADVPVVAAVAISIGVILSLFARSRVTDIIADERDYANGGTAARYTLFSVTAVGALASLVLMFLRGDTSVYETISAVISYSVCATMLLYSAIFYYLNRKSK